MKIIKPTVHGYIDYIFAASLWLAPMLFGLGEQATLFSNILGSIHLVLTVFTNFKLGIFRFIPLEFTV